MTRELQHNSVKLVRISLHWGLNPGPSVYRTDALPLNYRGKCVNDNVEGISQNFVLATARVGRQDTTAHLSATSRRRSHLKKGGRNFTYAKDQFARVVLKIHWRSLSACVRTPSLTFIIAQLSCNAYQSSFLAPPYSVAECEA